MTVAATLATAPLIAFHFGELSTVTLVANLLALPAVAPAMWLGMLRAAGGQVPGFPVGAAQRARRAAARLHRPGRRLVREARLGQLAGAPRRRRAARPPTRRSPPAAMPPARCAAGGARLRRGRRRRGRRRVPDASARRRRSSPCVLWRVVLALPGGAGGGAAPGPPAGCGYGPRRRPGRRDPPPAAPGRRRSSSTAGRPATGSPRCSGGGGRAASARRSSPTTSPTTPAGSTNCSARCRSRGSLYGVLDRRMLAQARAAGAGPADRGGRRAALRPSAPRRALAAAASCSRGPARGEDPNRLALVMVARWRGFSMLLTRRRGGRVDPDRPGPDRRAQGRPPRQRRRRPRRAARPHEAAAGGDLGRRRQPLRPSDPVDPGDARRARRPHPAHRPRRQRSSSTSAEARVRGRSGASMEPPRTNLRLEIGASGPAPLPSGRRRRWPTEVISKLGQALPRWLIPSSNLAGEACWKGCGARSFALCGAVTAGGPGTARARCQPGLARPPRQCDSADPEGGRRWRPGRRRAFEPAVGRVEQTGAGDSRGPSPRRGAGGSASFRPTTHVGIEKLVVGRSAPNGPAAGSPGGHGGVGAPAGGPAPEPACLRGPAAAPPPRTGRRPPAPRLAPPAVVEQPTAEESSSGNGKAKGHEKRSRSGRGEVRPGQGKALPRAASGVAQHGSGSARPVPEAPTPPASRQDRSGSPPRQRPSGTASSRLRRAARAAASRLAPMAEECARSI